MRSNLAEWRQGVELLSARCAHVEYHAARAVELWNR